MPSSMQTRCFVLFIPRLWIAVDGSCSQLSHKEPAEGYWVVAWLTSPRHLTHTSLSCMVTPQNMGPAQATARVPGLKDWEQKGNQRNHLLSHHRMPRPEGTQAIIPFNVLIGKMEKLGLRKGIKKCPRSPSKLVTDLGCKYKLPVH